MAKAPKTQSGDDAMAFDETAPSMSVRMTRTGEGYKPPHEADVHVDEVDNWAKHGWQRAD